VEPSGDSVLSDADVVVIGAGVIGLACAADLARHGREVIVLERLDGPGRETTSRNSEVIHAGLYYPPGSLKALTCVEGRELLYRRARSEGIPHRRTGKLVVGTTDDEVEQLAEILARARANGAGDLELIDAAELARREPRVRGLGALWSPESGIVDAHALCNSYQAEAESAGTRVVFHTEVVDLERVRGIWSVVTRAADGAEFRLETPLIVNAAGLGAARLATLAGVDVERAGWSLHLCKGDYFSVAPALGQIAHHLVYPVPVPGGLGIHVTLDLAGRYRLGPDVEWVDRVRYDVDPAKAEHFAAAVRRYLPELRASDLRPDFAGIRPKLVAEGEPPGDFVIEECSERGAPGLIALLGIESPGLTASAAIARRVSALVAGAA
jgi:L-2-hydroxyglutarate oxidase LhgO